ncbi:MAG: putative photosynthetic complex assembly protein PuhE [Myxococcota bacterium]
MNDPLIPILSVAAVWWLGTGVVLRLVWLPRRTHRTSLLVFSVLALLGFVGVIGSSTVPTVGAAYLGFGSALAIWAWHELTFLLGVISGPRKIPCWPEVSTWVRFRDATAAVIHHELALAFTAAALVVMTWDAPNQVATWTFVVLWIMRLSAKLNIFVGVRNLSEEFIPPHLRYLTSYFRKARFSPLIIVSLAGAGLALMPLVGGVLDPEASAFTVCSHALVATMLGLGMLEHVFLALPVPDAVLWRWAFRPRAQGRAAARSAKHPRARGGLRNPWFALGMIDQWLPK